MYLCAFQGTMKSAERRVRPAGLQPGRCGTRSGSRVGPSPVGRRGSSSQVWDFTGFSVARSYRDLKIAPDPHSRGNRRPDWWEDQQETARKAPPRFIHGLYVGARCASLRTRAPGGTSSGP